jgi:hypothetical protein
MRERYKRGLLEGENRVSLECFGLASSQLRAWILGYFQEAAGDMKNSLRVFG